MDIDALLSKAALWEVWAVLLRMEKLALLILEVAIRKELAFNFLFVLTMLLLLVLFIPLLPYVVLV